MAEKTIKYDIDGYSVVTTAIMELLNTFPLLNGDEFQFSTLEASGGKAVFPSTGAAIERETEDITGHVRQICNYPFDIVYRTSNISSIKKERVKEWLDSLGKWLEKQRISSGSDTFWIENYPPLTDGRKFKTFSRITPAFFAGAEQNGAENWIISISARYQNDFQRF